MRILLVSHAAGPYGAERVLLALADGLAGRGHDVVLDFPHPGPAVERAQGTPGIRLSVRERHRLPRRAAEVPGFVASGPGSVAAVRRRVRQVEPDLVWVNSLYNPWGALGARLGGTPVVWHLHERSLPGPPGAGMALYIGLLADRIVTVSDFVAGGYRRYPWLRRRLRVVANPLLGTWSPVDAEPEGAFTVGYVGQLEPRKRVIDLVRAIGLLSGARGVIVGDGKARGEVDAAIRASGAASRIERPGYQEDVGAWLARFHCLAIPSLREPFGLVAVEAMASGVPVVAARSGALPDVLGDAALYHEPGDATDLARQLERLEEDPSLRRTLRERGLDRARRFDRERWLDAVEVVINSVASTGSGR